MFTVGVDIIEINRFSRARFIDRVAEFFLTANEIAQIQAENKKAQFFASRFALKEAIIKAFPEPIDFHEFEIVKYGKKPTVKFLKKRFQNYKVAVSLSHSETMAIGFAAVEI